MKKVLIASYNLGYGGIETSLINLLKNIDLKKFEVTLVLEKKEGVFLSDVPSSIKLKEYRVNNNKNVFIRKSINLLKRIKWLVFNYKRYDSSVCYATYSGPCSFLARTASNNKIMLVHSNYYEAFNKNENKVQEFFSSVKVNDYNNIIFVSNEARYDFNKVYPHLKNKTKTINNIVDYKKIIELSEEKIDIKKPDGMTFLFVGRLDETSKRLSILLDVAKKCKDEKIKATFWIVGNGPDEKKYKSIVNKLKLDNIIFFGSKKNPYPYMKACNYLILTSRYEGFPVVYNEAIVLEKPIITTIDVSDDFITIPKRFGYVVSEENLFEKVKELTKKEEKIKEKPDYDKLNKKRINMIEEIMECR